jgi:tRNA(Ile)-lysidine synthetase-like protein
LFFVENGFFHNAEESFVLEPGESKFLWKREVKNNSGEKVVVRPPMPGEKAYFRHSKKVKDFLIDQKVFYHWRSHVKVLETVQGGFLGIIEPVGEKIYLNENGEGKIGFSGLSE